MPFDRNAETGKLQFSFSNLLALIITLACLFYLFWVSLVMSKEQARENTTMIQVITAIIALMVTIVNYYFGNSNNSAKQAAQITEMQKNATTIALNTSNPGAANTELKVDKAVALTKLRAELDALDPESDDAKKLLAEIERLEKLS